MDFKALNATDQRAIATAATIAREQLRFAVEIVKELKPGEPDSTLVGAVLMAIATNQPMAKGS